MLAHVENNNEIFSLHPPVLPLQKEVGGWTKYGSIVSKHQMNKIYRQCNGDFPIMTHIMAIIMTSYKASTTPPPIKFTVEKKAEDVILSFFLT